MSDSLRFQFIDSLLTNESFLDFLKFTKIIPWNKYNPKIFGQQSKILLYI